MEDHFQWYKNVRSIKERHTRLLDTYQKLLPYFLTGINNFKYSCTNPSEEVIRSINNLISQISDYTSYYPSKMNIPQYPITLNDFFKSEKDTLLREFNDNLVLIFETLSSDRYNELLGRYEKLKVINKLWGTPYHYISFIKQ